MTEFKDPNELRWKVWTLAFIAIAIAEWLELFV